MTILSAVGLAVAAPFATAAEPQYIQGWPVNVGPCHDSSPAVADVDGDGRREIAIATWDGKLYLLDANGRPLSGFPASTGAQHGECSSPALADLDGDRKLEVLFASGDGKLYAFGHDGIPVPGWPKELGAAGSGGVAVQDFTNYRGLEVFATAGAALYGFHGNGTAIGGWPATLEEPSHGFPAVGDLDGDQQPEVVVASDRKIYAFNTSGAEATGWPVALDGQVAGAPVLADVDGDGRTEVLAGTTTGLAYVVDADGTFRPGWPQSFGAKPITVPAAVGDVDGRGKLALVFVGGARYIEGATIGVFDADGISRPGFPKQLRQTVAAAPLMVDADGDGLPEILLVTYDGTLLSYEKNGAPTGGFPVKLSGTGITSTPAATDVDEDGFLDVVVGAQNGCLEAIRTEAAYEPSANPWPMFGGNHWRTGKYLAPAADRQPFTLAVQGGAIIIRWKAEPTPERSGWAIFKGIRDHVSGSTIYYEIAYVEEQPTASYSYRDDKVNDGTIYYYKLEERLSSGRVRTYGPKAVRAVGGAAKPRSAITRCYPNPFVTQVNIAYEVAPVNGDAPATSIAVYDISGKLIRYLVNEAKTPGKYVAEWDGTDAGGAPVASGVYVACLRVGKTAPPSTRTVVLVR